MEETRTDLVPQAVAPAEAPVQPDSFGVTDYVRELFLNSEEQKKLEKKKLRLMRVCVALVSLATLVVVVSAAVLVPKLMTTVTQVNDMLTIVQQIDIKAITTNIDALAVQANDTFQSVGEAVTVLDALDMDTLNATIAELKTGVQSFSELDIDTLNDAIANLNATIEPFARFFNKS